jgi:Tol biopolymer transport system component
MFRLDGTVTTLKIPLPKESILGCASFLDDETLLVERSDPPNMLGEVWQVDIFGRGLEQVISQRGCNVASPRVDPLMRYISYGTGCDTGVNRGVWLYDLSTGEKVHLLQGRLGSASWSPDGMQLAYVRTSSAGDDPEIWIVNRDGSDDQLLVSAPASFPAWAREPS